MANKRQISLNTAILGCADRISQQIRPARPLFGSTLTKKGPNVGQQTRPLLRPSSIMAIRRGALRHRQRSLPAASSASATSTQLSAAPTRTLSAVSQNARPASVARTRLTQMRSDPATSIGVA
ncbi:hypothetical protein DFP86_102216 [Paludibacterium purpuratum]|uniref:Uncharacterized protein n=1 Tax=Paludibacterium purpuratum TaxID=1144873 RepID=A0A4R7BD56_9NEIS|nr:hypothetical protein DFP86_102216 [Paludibacterium purpuratum]